MMATNRCSPIDLEVVSYVDTDVNFYRDIAHAARTAALMSTWGFRKRLGRDVAGCIGQAIYDLRLDVLSWVNPCQRNTAL
jgi:hypothetical protein